MLILLVTLQVKPDRITEFLDLVRFDAQRSQEDEPGCLRFDVSQDRDQPDRFYFYEVYRDEAALEAHRRTPHFKLYLEKSPPLLAAPPERHLAKNVVPVDAAWR